MDEPTAAPTLGSPFSIAAWLNANALRLILFGAFVTRLIALKFVDGQIWPDEIYQTIEPAQHAAFGLGILPWEWDTGIRSWLVPWFYAAIFRFVDLFGAPGPGDLVRVAQLINVGLSLLVVHAAWTIAHSIAGRRAALLAALFAAFALPTLFFAPRTLSDSTAAALLVFAYSRFVVAEDPHVPGPPSPRAHLFVGAIFGLVYLFRFSSLIYFVGPGIALIGRWRLRELGAMIAGFAIVALGIGLIDWTTWGTPFHSIIEYVKFNVIKGGGKGWGTQPADWYVAVIVRDLGVAGIIAVAVAARGGAGSRGVGLGILIGLFVMSFEGHKEERFLAPIWAALPVFIGLGTERTIKAFSTRSHALGRLAGVIVFATVFLSSTAAFKKKDWRPAGDWFDGIRYAAKQPDATGMIVVQEWWQLGGYVNVGRPIPMVTSASPAALPYGNELVQNELLNYLVIDMQAGANLMSAATQIGFEPRVAFGRINVLRRR